MHRYFSKTQYLNILDPITKPQKTKVMTMNPYIYVYTCQKFHNSFINPMLSHVTIHDYFIFHVIPYA